MPSTIDIAWTVALQGVAHLHVTRLEVKNFRADMDDQQMMEAIIDAVNADLHRVFTLSPEAVAVAAMKIRTALKGE